MKVEASSYPAKFCPQKSNQLKPGILRAEVCDFSEKISKPDFYL
jgi:hypothetical protein